ncbi:MAG: hypothetical protein K2X81_22790 [Candidatus Obscuribacterales bacterium]|nr:hypothetical protein [Candidatus Obscuribacterales bacterium]
MNYTISKKNKNVSTQISAPAVESDLETEAIELKKLAKRTKVWFWLDNAPTLLVASLIAYIGLNFLLSFPENWLTIFLFTGLPSLIGLAKFTQGYRKYKRDIAHLRHSWRTVNCEIPEQVKLVSLKNTMGNPKASGDEIRHKISLRFNNSEAVRDYFVRKTEASLTLFRQVPFDQEAFPILPESSSVNLYSSPENDEPVAINWNGHFLWLRADI